MIIACASDHRIGVKPFVDATEIVVFCAELRSAAVAVRSVNAVKHVGQVAVFAVFIDCCGHEAVDCLSISCGIYRMEISGRTCEKLAREVDIVHVFDQKAEVFVIEVFDVVCDVFVSLQTVRVLLQL